MTRSLYTGVSTNGGTVTVYWAGTSTKPTIYVGLTGAAKSNPITAEVDGSYSFYIDDGHYKIVNGTPTGDLTDVRISYVPEAAPSAKGISVLPFLGNTATTQEAFNEAVVAGSLSQSAGTFTGPITGTQSIGATSTDGLVLQNTTAATVALDQWSPRLRLKGYGWETSGADSSKSGDWIIENKMAQSANTSPYSTLSFSYSDNGGAYSQKMFIDKDGVLAPSGIINVTDATDAIAVNSGSIVTAGGIGVTKAAWVGGLADIAGAITGHSTIAGVTANGSSVTLASASENLTLSTGGTTTDTAADLLPAGAIILAVTGTVTTTITTATDWKLGDPTTAGRFSAVNATMTAGSSSIGLLQMAGDVSTVAAGPTQASAAKVRVTTTGTPGAGAIRITVWYLQFVAPTS